MSPPLSILLVGEGNFSYSACLSHLYSDTETRITATCLQAQKDTLRHECAASNIQIINDSGGEVIFGVDCRKLGECEKLHGRVFDRVVFNFPHCGRKSGVKKNRDLLKNFFVSCVQVLADDGEVHVSLCNGQGGTPADRPQRERHNSWQVVAMAAEAHLILRDIQPFESEKYQSYKCTGYRSQDKGFHVEKALLHVFARSLHYTSDETLKVEEVVEGEKVQYNIPAELSDYIFRGFLCSDSVHPVALVQDYLLKGLSEKWSVHMVMEIIPFLLTAKQLQLSCQDIDSEDCYWIHLLQKDRNADSLMITDKVKDSLMLLDKQGNTDTENPPSTNPDKVDRLSSRGQDVDPQEESGDYVLRPSLLSQIEELRIKKEDGINDVSSHGESEGNNKSVEVLRQKNEGLSRNCNSVPGLLFGISGLVFRKVPVNLWALPCFHELLYRGVFPSESKPITLIGHWLETLLAPYGVSLVTKQGDLCLMAQPMGLVGRVFACTESNNASNVTITVSLNLDILAVLLFSLPDWRLLWSHDPQFSKQFELHPSPGEPFHPFSLFPEHINFDISFWTGPSWEEWKFHAVVREASHGTVKQVKLFDTFSHPDLSQTSYCYRLTYHTHTHALSHTQALKFHKHLESLLASRLQVTIR